MQPREIVWLRLDEPGREHLRVVSSEEGFQTHSEGWASLDGGFRFRAFGHFLPDWSCRRLTVELQHADGPWRTLALERNGHQAAWLVNGLGRRDLDGCEEPDLSCSPITNPPAAFRLLRSRCDLLRLRVAYIRIPSLTVVAMDQEYTRLPSPSGLRRFRYHDDDNAFTGELTIDGDGLVVDYAGLFRRE